MLPTKYEEGYIRMEEERDMKVFCYCLWRWRKGLGAGECKEFNSKIWKRQGNWFSPSVFEGSTTLPKPYFQASETISDFWPLELQKNCIILSK